MMKLFKYIILAVSVLFTALIFTACSDDDEGGSGSIPSDLYGKWYATVGEGKGSVYVTFNRDKTGYQEYTWDSGIRYHTAEFTFSYTMNGSTINCKGVLVDSEDGVSQCSRTFKYSGGKLTGGNYVTDAPYQKIN